MEKVKIETGNHFEQDPECIYVLQLIKFHGKSFDSGSVVKEFVLEKVKSTILQFNVR